MKSKDEKTTQKVTELRRWVKKLLMITKAMMQKIQYSEDDHFAFMSLCFLAKQRNHTESILALKESRDVGLIARSMIEGIIQLLWAAKDPVDRAFRWRYFVWITDWRLLQEKIAADKSVKKSRIIKIEEVLLQYGNQFLTKKEKNKLQKGEELSNDPYCKNWTGHTGSYIFTQVEDKELGKVLYHNFYKPYSRWHHWCPGGLGTAIARYENRSIFSPESPQETAKALVVSFQCLFQTLEVVNEYLKLGISQRLNKLLKEFEAWHEQGNKSDKKSS